MKPLLSLIVLGYKSFDVVTRNCLDSLRPWFHDPRIEILIVDNGSPDTSGRLTEDWCSKNPGARFLLSEVNRGFAGGMNWGASHAQGEWRLLVNYDTIFPELTLNALLRVLSEAPSSVGMVGPVTNAAGNGQRLWKPDASYSEWLQIGKQLHDAPTRELMPVYRCDFFCIAIRRSVWIELGGLDESFGLGYYEDFDFSLRLRAAGYEQMISDDVFVLHTGSATFGGSSSAHALIRRNKQLLKAKHPDARFEHTRQGNLLVLQRYMALKEAGTWGPNMLVRWDLRVGALTGDVPRSFIKRWCWLLKVKRMLKGSI